ncbi:uncharacterized protein LOC134248922 [Saccostrea cucullata]|uniref:uncharacterized protein LOC134248922 n=1 Tax=Saccostrea cuccullata TaxID=36930 RepID=UPI002ED409F2
MVVLKTLSTPDSIILQSGCNRWYWKIQLKSQRAIDILQPYLLHCHSTSHMFENYFGNRQSFLLNFWKKITIHSEARKLGVEKHSGKIFTTQPVDLKQKLYFNYEKKFHIPESDYKVKNPLVPIENTTIGVDLMLAIEHPNLEMVTSFSDFPPEFKELLFKHGCHIVTKSCHVDHFPKPPCLFISFAAMELELMKNMDEHHKESYKILKSLLIGENDLTGKCMNVSSYVLKSAFLFHVYGGNKCVNRKLYAPCIHDILDYLANSLFDIKMPTFFARSINTWGYILEVPCFAWPEFETKGSSHEELTFAFCWIKLWYRIIKYLKTTIIEASELNQDEWMQVIDRCEYMKRTTYYVIERYRSSSLPEVFQGHLSNEDLAGKTLALCSDELFIEYVQQMEKYHNIKLGYIL